MIRHLTASILSWIEDKLKIIERQRLATFIPREGVPVPRILAKYDGYTL